MSDRGGEPRRLAAIVGTTLHAIAEHAAVKAREADRAAYARIIARGREIVSGQYQSHGRNIHPKDLLDKLESEFCK